MPSDRERNLENELRDLGPHIEYPPTPDLTDAVKSRLDAGDDPSATPARSGPSLWWLAAAALVLLTVLPVLSPAVRDMAAGVFSAGAGGMAGGAAEGGGQGGGAASPGDRAAGGGSVTGESAMSSAQGAQAGSAAGAASVSPGDAASASAIAGGGPKRITSGEGLGLGERITPREARVRSETPILLPRSSKLGKPDEAYDRKGARGFTFLYRARRTGLPVLSDTGIGLLLTQASDDVGAAYLSDRTAEGAGLEKVSINGEEGYWIPVGGNAPEVARSAGLLSGVLLWERDDQALRLEADVSKEEAVRIAESVR